VSSRGVRELTTVYHSPPHWLYNLSSNHYRRNKVADIVGMGGLLLFCGGLIAEILSLAFAAYTELPAIAMVGGFILIVLSAAIEITTDGQG
jgi:uncharacterized membrane protein YgdD (TMEM256/DUF423 family)